ncbi:hypothetical protein MWU54_18460 [Marivita sp. S6314]|uniref:hypothetical protein n=1 Tax=Marivita sp. S6314 TaxID=2926406 RepID=UPI001FF51DE8|nr:hypothetical protein [Marivita sp. S6314]MCK0152033.1 hypothetical protein [Marivita sp. S6314]
MTARFLLHIGANKTGTSSIQRMLVDNADALGRAGWSYPDVHLMHCAHHRLAYSLADHPTRGLPEGWRGAWAQATGDPTQRIVVSSELFFRNVPPQAAAQLFPPGQTQIVLYLREHLGYLASWYAQAVQERNLTASFDDYIRLFPQAFDTFLKRWEAVYGREAITLRPFRRDAFPDGDIRQDFLQQMGGVDGIRMPPTDSNLTISGNLLFFKRLLNHVMSYDEAHAPPIPDEFGAYAELRETFRGRFETGPETARLVAHIFAKDRAALQARGLDLGPVPERVTGHPDPNFDTLQDEVALIAQVAEDTGKAFLPFARRLPVWPT